MSQSPDLSGRAFVHKLLKIVPLMVIKRGPFDPKPGPSAECNSPLFIRP